MSAEKKSNQLKQRRKSPCGLVVIHDVKDTHNGGRSISSLLKTAPVSNGIQRIANARSTLHPMYESSPNVSVDSSKGSTPRKLSVSSDPPGDGSPGWSSSPVRRSHTEPDIVAISGVDDVFSGSASEFNSDISGLGNVVGSTSSIRRPVCIEEELCLKVQHISNLVALWRNRWKQQKEHSDSLAKKIQKTEKECSAMVENIQCFYVEKVKQARKELSKEIIYKQRLERDRASAEVSYKRTLQQHNIDKDKLQKLVHGKTKELEQSHSIQDEARITIKDLKKELSKVKRENEKLVKDISNLSKTIEDLQEDNRKKSQLMYMSCNGHCEHKLLFDLAIQRLQFYEKNENYATRRQSQSWSKGNTRNNRRMYRVLSDPADPLNISIEKDFSGSSIEGQFPDIPTSPSMESPRTDTAKSCPVTPSVSLEQRNSTSTGASTLSPKLCTAGKTPCSTGAERHVNYCSTDSTCSTTESYGSAGSLETQQRNESMGSTSTADSLDVPSQHTVSSPHLPLKKSMTADYPDTHSELDVKRPSLVRRLTWTQADFISSENLKSEDKPSSMLYGNETQSEGEQVTLTKPNAISVFEGLRERRNGITEMDKEVSLQLKLSSGTLGGKGKKGKDLADMLKKFSFSGTHGYSESKERDVSGTEKKNNFINMSKSRFSKKKPNHD